MDKFCKTKRVLCKIIGKLEEAKRINVPNWWGNGDMNV